MYNDYHINYHSVLYNYIYIYIIAWITGNIMSWIWSIVTSLKDEWQYATQQVIFQLSENVCTCKSLLLNIITLTVMYIEWQQLVSSYSFWNTYSVHMALLQFNIAAAHVQLVMSFLTHIHVYMCTYVQRLFSLNGWACLLSKLRHIIQTFMLPFILNALN